MIKNYKDSVNRIGGVREVFRGEPPQFEITIKKDGEIVFCNKVYSGVLCVVNGDIRIDDSDGTVEADKQTLGFGNPILQVFCYDMIKQQLLPELKKVVEAEYAKFKKTPFLSKLLMRFK